MIPAENAPNYAGISWYPPAKGSCKLQELLRELKQQRPWRLRTKTSLEKVNSRWLKLYRAYSVSFNSSNVGKCFWSWILKDCIKVHEKKKKVAVRAFTSWTKREIGHFHVAESCSDGKEMYKIKKRDARAKLLFCQSKPIALFLFSLLKLPLPLVMGILWAI